jgi:hypothetical protein
MKIEVLLLSLIILGLGTALAFIYLTPWGLVIDSLGFMLFLIAIYGDREENSYYPNKILKPSNRILLNPERQITVIKDILYTDDYLSKYDLYVTDRRLVVIQTKFGYVGSNFVDIIEQRDEAAAKRKKELKEKFENLGLDEKIGCRYENFAVNYEDIIQIKLNDQHFPWREATLKIVTKKKKAKFHPTKEQFEQLTYVLSNIGALWEKLVINKNAHIIV